ncbi:hypothetical protein PPERSA_02117 [Pseudocohnilembus persalinus]|uniref:Uncharacterized protein n=1 Tax=Pseudocohnilembus persalinus TaxID=266149 RepID=A0A0V0Q8G6_PSEPJ|nr:hypothetical protein PPERSA_02117 [Pseudocohnilembus persalinus]|eukprot:KRW98340.1 hypothetical protein PPERSA_02117 [Pseudocohnilembus persalinus]
MCKEFGQFECNDIIKILFSKESFQFGFVQGIKTVLINKYGQSVANNQQDKENENEEENEIEEEGFNVNEYIDKLGIEDVFKQGENYFDAKRKNQNIIENLSNNYESTQNTFWDQETSSITTKFKKDVNQADRFFGKRLKRNIQTFQNVLNNLD